MLLLGGLCFQGLFSCSPWPWGFVGGANARQCFASRVQSPPFQRDLPWISVLCLWLRTCVSGRWVLNTPMWLFKMANSCSKFHLCFLGLELDELGVFVGFSIAFSVTGSQVRHFAGLVFAVDACV